MNIDFINVMILKKILCLPSLFFIHNCINLKKIMCIIFQIKNRKYENRIKNFVFIVFIIEQNKCVQKCIILLCIIKCNKKIFNFKSQQSFIFVYRIMIFLNYFINCFYFII